MADFLKRISLLVLVSSSLLLPAQMALRDPAFVGSLAPLPPPIVGDWQDTANPANVPFTTGTSSGNGVAVKIVANSSGIVSKLRWYFAGRLTANIKLALYTDSGGSPDVPIASGLAASPVNDGSSGYIELTGLSQPVFNGVTYWIAIAHDNNALTYAYNPVGGDRAYHLGGEDMFFFPENPYVPDGSDTALFVAGMFK